MSQYQWYSSGGPWGVADESIPLNNETITQTLYLYATNSLGTALTKAKVWFAGNGNSAYHVQSASLVQGSASVTVTVNGQPTFDIPAFGRWSDYVVTTSFTLPGNVSFVSINKLSVPILIPIIGNGDSTPTGSAAPGTILGFDDSGSPSASNNNLILTFEGINDATEWTESANDLTPEFVQSFKIGTDQYYSGTSSLKSVIAGAVLPTLLYTIPNIKSDDYFWEFYFRYSADLGAADYLYFDMYDSAVLNVNGATDSFGGLATIWVDLYTDNLNLYLKDRVGTVILDYDDTTTYAKNTWHKVKVIASGRTVSFYVNDVLITTATASIDEPLRGINNIYYRKEGPTSIYLWCDNTTIKSGTAISTIEVTSTGTITVSDNTLIVSGDTITIKDVTYTLVDVLTGAANQILIGSTATLTAANIADFINDIPGAMFVATSSSGVVTWTAYTSDDITVSDTSSGITESAVTEAVTYTSSSASASIPSFTAEGVSGATSSAAASFPPMTMEGEGSEEDFISGDGIFPAFTAQAISYMATVNNNSSDAAKIALLMYQNDWMEWFASLVATPGDPDDVALVATQWVASNITYHADTSLDDWNDPRHTIYVGLGDCVANYEEVYTKDGIKKVGDLKVGDLLLSYDFGKKEYVYKPITKIWEKGLLQGLSVGLRNGQHIDISDGHPMWVRSNQGWSNGKKVASKYEKKYFKDIDLEGKWWERRLPIATKIPYETKDIEWLTEELCFVLGHYLAEGWKDKGGKISTCGYDITNHILPILKKHKIPYTAYISNHGVPCANILKSSFKDFLRTLKDNSFNIHLPEEIFHLPESKLRAILDGYFLGDGHNGNYPDKKGFKNNKQEVYSTSSLQWATDLQRIGLQLGQSFHVWKQEHHQGVGDKPIYRVTHNTNSYFYKDHGYGGLSEVGIATEHIEDLGLVEMRDFEVADTHTFVFKNGLICHQCEDGAFLAASIMINSGVDPTRVRVYIGETYGVGHAWITYKRYIDNQWVVLDWTEGSTYWNAIGDVNDLTAIYPSIKSISDLGLNPDLWSYGTATSYIDASWVVTLSGTGYLNSLYSSSLLTELIQSIPAITLEAHSGGYIDKRIPSISLTASGRSDVIGKLTKNIPLITLTAAAIQSEIARLTSSIPAIILTASGIESPVASLSQSIPIIKITASGIVGTVGSLSKTIAALILTGNAYWLSPGTATIEIPSIRLTALARAISIIGLSLNTKNFGLTKYTGFDYDNLCVFKGKVIGSKKTGIYELEGTKDDTSAIAWKLRTGKLDIGALRYVWLLGTVTGDIKMVVETSDGERYEYDGEPVSTNETGVRIKVGKGIRKRSGDQGRYINLEFYNESDELVTIDKIQLYGMK